METTMNTSLQQAVMVHLNSTGFILLVVGITAYILLFGVPKTGMRGSKKDEKYEEECLKYLTEPHPAILRVDYSNSEGATRH